jgi:RimJ/RimL family protein N-acetyltransferase
MPSPILAEEMENDSSSEVITLRPYKESDADDFLGYAGDDQVTRFTRWNTFSCKEEALVYIKDFCIPHPYCRSICVNDRSIGFVYIRQESGDDKCRAELGYAIAAKYWGQGVTTRALKMAISDGLRSFPDLVRLQARVDVENKASQRVLEKLGFLKEGVLRKYMYNKGKVIDLVVYSLLSTDPMP